MRRRDLAETKMELEPFIRKGLISSPPNFKPKWPKIIGSFIDWCDLTRFRSATRPSELTQPILIKCIYRHDILSSNYMDRKRLLGGATGSDRISWSTYAITSIMPAKLLRLPLRDILTKSSIPTASVTMNNVISHQYWTRTWAHRYRRPPRDQVWYMLSFFRSTFTL